VTKKEYQNHMLYKKEQSVKKSNILKTTKNLQEILKSNSKKVSLKFFFKDVQRIHIPQ
jgi:hypothetical protein